ncbi:hypothetical protein HDE_12658 [Halotydeus destructor]|nr:hypothetical protein HDE_12658 [Halotydeus destructor]
MWSAKMEPSDTSQAGGGGPWPGHRVWSLPEKFLVGLLCLALAQCAVETGLMVNQHGLGVSVFSGLMVASLHVLALVALLRKSCWTLITYVVLIVMTSFPAFFYSITGEVGAKENLLVILSLVMCSFIVGLSCYLSFTYRKTMYSEPIVSGV